MVTITFDVNKLLQGPSGTVGGLGFFFTASNGGTVTVFDDDVLGGLWASLGVSGGDYTLSFTRAVQSIEFDFIFLDGIETPVEVLSNFIASNYLTPDSAAPADITLTDQFGVSFANGVVTADPNALGIGTIGFDGNFTNLSFHHSQHVDNNGFTINAIRVTIDAPVLFLDFESPLPLIFQAEPNPKSPGSEHVVMFAGTSATVSFSETQRANIVAAVQAIFDRSGINIFVTDIQPSEGTYQTVRFGPNLTYDKDGDGGNDRVLGLAYEKVDQFNANPSSNVAIFMSASDTLERIAETIAHEAGHGYGARHVNPYSGTGVEVMDYHDSATPMFPNIASFVREPPRDGSLFSFSIWTHNPTYHLRRYVIGDTDAQLRAEGITPGSWDVIDKENADRVIYVLTFGVLGIDLDSIFIAINEGGGFDDGEIPTLIGENVAQGGSVQFSVPLGATFTLLGKSEGSSDFDVVIGGSNWASGETSFTNNGVQNINGVVLRSNGGTLTSIGSASGAATATPGTYIGTANADTRNGSNSESDLMLGMAQNDTLNGRGGDDILSGGDGADTLTGGAGMDFLHGDAGADIMRGEGGDDSYLVDNAGDQAIEANNAGFDSVQSSVSYQIGNYIEVLVLDGSANINGTGNGRGNVIRGNAGANVLDGKASGDTLIGGLGDDIYVVDHFEDKVIEAANEGTDSVRAYSNHTLTANVENLTLAGTANINGGGNALNNVIRGNDGVNILTGGDGADFLSGFLGNDRLTGGAGADAFIFNTAPSNTTNRDTITDFNIVDDTIRIDNAIYTALGANGVLSAAAFFAGAAANDASDRIIYHASSGSLFYDPDGTGAAAQVRFAVVTANLALTNADFLVV